MVIFQSFLYVYQAGSGFYVQDESFLSSPEFGQGLGLCGRCGWSVAPLVQAESQSGFGSLESPKVYLMGMGEIL